MKVVIIGLGSIAQKHIKALREIDSTIEIIALRSSRNAKKKEGVRNIYSYEEMFEETPDFVIVSNPTSEHFNTLEKCSEIKIPLFIEKPVFSRIGEQQNDLVNNLVQNTKTYVACNLRFHTGILEMKRLLIGQKIEEVNSYCGSFLPDWRPNVDFRKVYSANADMGGGVHIDLIHELDYLYWFFGTPQNVKKTIKNNSSLQITAVDYANYLFEYDDFCANIILNYYRKEPKRTFEVLTKKGTYLLDLLKNSIYLSGQKIFEEKQEIQQMYTTQMRFFIDEVLRGKKFNTINEGYKVLKLCLKD